MNAVPGLRGEFLRQTQQTQGFTISSIHLLDASERGTVVQAAHAQLTTDVLSTTASTLPASERISQWQRANSTALVRTSAIVDDIVSNDTADLATLSVALREVRALVRAASLPSR